jgi:hypothetical protein
MDHRRVLFDVPAWVEAGTKTGRFSYFGGVVRDRAGHIVHMLKEGRNNAPQKGRWAVAALAIGAVTGLGYALYGRLGSKEQALDALAGVERAIVAYASEAHSQRLTVDHIYCLASEIQKLIATMEAPELRDAYVELDANATDKLCEFYASLRAFNGRLREQVKEGPAVPALVETRHLPELAHSIFDQLTVQYTLWPAYVQATQRALTALGATGMPPGGQSRVD